MSMQACASHVGASDAGGAGGVGGGVGGENYRIQKDHFWRKQKSKNP